MLEKFLGAISLASDRRSFAKPKGAASIRYAPQVVTLQAAQAAAPAALRVPADHALAGMRLFRVTQLVAEPPARQAPAATIFEYRNDSGDWLVLEQGHLKVSRMETPAGAETTRIGAQPAFVYQRTVEAQNRPGGVRTIEACVWELDGRLYKLQAAGLAREQVLAVASALL